MESSTDLDVATMSSTVSSSVEESTTTNVLEFFSSSGDIGNATDASAENGDEGALRDWQIILIASLSAGGIIIVAVFILMWKFCTRKPAIPTVHTRNVTPGPASTTAEVTITDSRVCCGCCRLGKGNRTSNDQSRGEMAQTSGSGHPSDEKEQFPGQHQSMPVRVLDARLPLPPIGDSAPLGDMTRASNGQMQLNDPLAMGRAHMMPRRLAPINEHSKVLATNLAGGTVVHRASAFGPVQQNTDLTMRGVSPMAFAMEQRRPLPPPPTD